MNKGMRSSLKLINTTLGPREVTFRQRQARLLTEAAHYSHYWALESLHFAYALACVEIVLLRSDKANTIYREVCRAWELPGCQILIDEFKLQSPGTKVWIGNLIRAREKNEAMPEWPSLWFDIYEQHKDNTDYEYLIERVSEFILVGFNRQKDQDNEAWKVLPGDAPFLIAAIGCLALAEHCKVKLEDLKKYRPEPLDRIMTGSPTSRVERHILRTIHREYRYYKWVLRHDSKLLKGADQWYQSRVAYSGPEEYCRKVYKKGDDYFLDPRNVGTKIKPYDYVTGYRRRS